MSQLHQTRSVRVHKGQGKEALAKLELYENDLEENELALHDKLMDFLVDIQHCARFNDLDLDLEQVCQLAKDIFEYEVLLEEGQQNSD